MKKDDRDKIDDIFRSKLYDFEPEALPDEVWEKVEGRLSSPPRYSLPSTTRWKQWLTAAAIALLVLGGGFYFFKEEHVDPVLTHEIEKKSEELKTIITEKEQTAPIKEQLAIAATPKSKTGSTPIATKATNLPLAVLQEEIPATANAANEDDIPTPAVDSYSITEDLSDAKESSQTEILQIEPVNEIRTGPKPGKTKRWSFGMGAGSVTAGSADVANIYAFRNTGMDNQQLEFLNSFKAIAQAEMPKTDIKHQQPVSFGLSASYMLAPRWYLQAGLNYSYLSSEWKTNGSYYSITKQRLHFVGIPVSLAYKIAEWNSFIWYTYAGFMPEVNVAGKVRETKYTNGQILGESFDSNIRMKEWYWSVNAGTGVSYPIFRFLNAFAEVGGGYYFNNGSKIETIHSDKPFNVNVSFGLRLGF